MKNMFQGLMLGLLVSLAAACNPHDSYCNRNEIALKDAAREGDTDAIDRLHARGVDVDAHCEQEDHHPAILLAARDGQLKAVQSLIEKGADVNEKTKCEYDEYDEDDGRYVGLGSTALSVAARKGHIKIVNALLHNKALVNRENYLGWTPLMEAAWMGYPNIAQLLIQHGADVNQRTEYGTTALSLARECNTGKTRRDLVRILKKEGATEDCPRSCLKYAPCIIRSLGNGISFLLGL